MIATSAKIGMSRNHLVFLHVFESNALVFSLTLLSIIANTINITWCWCLIIVCEKSWISSVTLTCWSSLVKLVDSVVWASSRYSTSRGSGRRTVWILLKLLQLSEYLVKLSLSLLLLCIRLRDNECALLVHEVGSAHTTANSAINSIPLPLEIGLYLFQPIECAHFLLRSLRGLLIPRAGYPLVGIIGRGGKRSAVLTRLHNGLSHAWRGPTCTPSVVSRIPKRFKSFKYILTEEALLLPLWTSNLHVHSRHTTPGQDSYHYPILAK